MSASSERDSGRIGDLPSGGRTDSAPESRSKGHRLSLGKAERLSRESEFRETFEAGESQPGRFVVLWIRRQPDASRRLGVVVSKRTFHHAVERNRAKRLMREAYRLQRDRLKPGVDILLLGRRTILKAKRQDVEKDLLRVYARTGLLEAEPRT